jgi:hypothetical protein
MPESPPRQLERVTSLAAAKVEDSVFGGEGENVGYELRLRSGDSSIIHDVGVGLEVERVEESTPPVGVNMLFEVEYGPEGLALTRPVSTLL